MIFLPNKIIAKNVLDNLSNIQFGAIEIALPDGSKHNFKGKETGENAHIKINSWHFFDYIFKRGDVGLGEAYIENMFESNDLCALLTFLTQNISYIEKFAHGNLFNKIVFFAINNFARRNSKNQSKKNIKAHYDVGNDFYKLWLDSSMTYSSGIFANQNISLEESQKNKYQRILGKISNSQNVLEIGCGWGGFAEAASKKHNLTALTISPKQFEYATKRLENQGLKADIKLQDYRDENKKYDAIVSIEMFEAVGEKYWPIYFQKINQSLEKGGKALIQTISIRDDLFDGYKKRSDYIRTHTFPGGMLPSLEKFKQQANLANLECDEVYSFGNCYAKTLRKWLENFKNVSSQIKKMGYKNEFIKSWEFYLALCIAGFEGKQTDVSQVLLKKS